MEQKKLRMENAPLAFLPVLFLLSILLSFGIDALSVNASFFVFLWAGGFRRR